MQLDYTGRIVLISGDSNVSRQLRDDLTRDFTQDHQIGGRVLTLDIKRKEFPNGIITYLLTDPRNALSMDEMKLMIKNSDSYFITKPENPLLADPIKYILDPLLSDFGKTYTNLLTSGLSKDEIEKRFLSYIASKLPEKIGEVVDRKMIENDLINLSNQIIKIFNNFSSELQDFFNDKKNEDVKHLDDKRLEMVKYTLAGYLNKLMKPLPQHIFIDELKAVTYAIGNEILNEKDIGRISVIAPWIDGRSDHNNKEPREIVRMRDFARDLGHRHVNRIIMIRGHSKRQIDLLKENNIEVSNLTQTNEYISILQQNPLINFRKLYVLSPDEGGLEDAMVFARELYRRTNGEFLGRVIVFRKERNPAGKIKGMSFLRSYRYNPLVDDKENFKLDEFGRPLPYDMVYDGEYKDKTSKDYIGNLFKIEFQKEWEEDLKEIISGHDAVLRDDIIASAETSIRAARAANKSYGSKIYKLIEHPSLVDDAIKNLDKLHEEGILAQLVTSTSIMHPNPGQRPWHLERPISGRIKSEVKRQYLKWLEKNVPDLYKRIITYTVQTPVHQPS